MLTPHADFPADGSGRPVTVTGRYDAAGQVLVAARLLHGRTGYWVVTPLVRDGHRRPARRRPRLRDRRRPGDTDRPSPARSRSRHARAGGVAAAPGRRCRPGSSGSVDLSLPGEPLARQIYNVFLFATGESPEATRTAGSAVERVPPPRLPSNGLSWRNAAYALQWWVFALFAACMWWRMVRDDHEGRSGTVDHLRTDLSERATHV